jgi:DNA-binding GntR family transcriptional regulator
MPLLHSPERARSRKKNLAHRIVDGVRREIVRQERLPGSKISEPMLAEAYGVSRAPAREALLQLEREGLVVFDAVGRTRVVEMTPEDFEDLFELRMTLEPAAVEHVTNRFDANLRSRLEANLEAMAGAASLAEVSWLDVEFHSIIMEASNRRRLIATWRAIHSQLLLWLSTMHQAHAESAKVRDITLAAHRRLVRIMAGGDAKQARAEAVKHLNDWRPVIAGMANARPRKGASR